MAAELIQITLDEQDEPVLSFTHNPAASGIEQKLLGALIRKAKASGGLELHVALVYGESDEKPLWDYHIRAKRAESL
ncbi:hypothetical protein G8759_31300 [Spirosoma aureum]|uniref:Uncharacterized protein n=1 Tax=Spirosoma aureum TaxID=2692134 RepID=A0A6G9AWE8_9BACT|nr:hypothetical protein [Spirosoma aureum]QIP16811.1 hypothetical protein G8759_31300 [Spirosoma aureum]